MATVREMCEDALNILGVYGAGEDPTSDDIDVTFRAFTMLREQWSNERLYQPARTTTLYTWSAGAPLKSIGLSGDFETGQGKPLTLDQAFIRDSNGNDFALRIITDRDYRNLVVKTMESTLPGFIFYDPGRLGNLATGTLYLWPIPQVEVSVSLTMTLAMYTYALADTFNDPPGYQEALVHALAVRIAPRFNVPVPASVVEIAREAKAAIKRNNLDKDEMDLPSGYGGVGGRWSYRSGWWA